jgi:hypothetical protein
MLPDPLLSSSGEQSNDGRGYLIQNGHGSEVIAQLTMYGGKRVNL